MKVMKECPFCGSPKVSISESFTTVDTHVACDACGAKGPDRSDQQSAIAVWDTRAKTKAPPVAVLTLDELRACPWSFADLNTHLQVCQEIIARESEDSRRRGMYVSQEKVILKALQKMLCAV